MLTRNSYSLNHDKDECKKSNPTGDTTSNNQRLVLYKCEYMNVSSPSAIFLTMNILPRAHLLLCSWLFILFFCSFNRYRCMDFCLLLIYHLKDVQIQNVCMLFFYTHHDLLSFFSFPWIFFTNIYINTYINALKESSALSQSYQAVELFVAFL